LSIHLPNILIKLMTSWLSIAADSDFSIHNFPFGIYQHPDHNEPRACSAIGEYIIDLGKANDLDFFHDLDIPTKIFQNKYLNDFIALGKATTNTVRKRLQWMFAEQNYLGAKELMEYYTYPMSDVKMLLPVQIGDYTDFYSSREHATNVGVMFRDPANALLPNWLHLPVGYHGRASSIVVSGTEIHRPKGQMLPPEGGETPIFGATKRLDFELEMAFIIGKNTELGEAISTDEADDYIFGMVLFNDWSARDIQQWEYVPLGPFLGKNFASTMSPWIVTLEALAPFACDGPVQEDKKILPYLEFEGQKNYDIALSVQILPENGDAKTVCTSNFKYMYWNMAQQLAHHTVNGCNINVGDMLASGTISGPTPDSYGSMLEIAWKGTKPVLMPDGSERRFINDGDTVILKGFAEKNGVRVGFGEASGKIK
jgi:fumarylacetoacetase